MNPQRGEIALEIGGETRKLCLTLGALAEIEAALGCESLKDLSARLKRVSAKDLQLVLAPSVEVSPLRCTLALCQLLLQPRGNNFGVRTS